MSHRSLIGKPAPAITLPNYDGESFTLTPGRERIADRSFLLPQIRYVGEFFGIQLCEHTFFSGSYGCTKEACQFRDAIAEKDTYKPGKVEVIGVSPDSVEKQKAFVEKNKLTYPVLSDSKGEAAKAYGIGKGLFGLADVARVTILIDAQGNIRDTVEGTLNYGAHSKFVTKWLDKLAAEEKAAAEPAPVAAAEEAAPAVPVTDAPAEPAA
ncbi:Peroxiredoxin Q [Mycena venus]|uniref:thioredoxin-dependent peroxiredoxin n=1 Tax=Mycena venus TaxID=2733690 RepID=A0A8H7DAT7_9AGAR|nr:Peroxiredoxin Q [Mycena venus]